MEKRKIYGTIIGVIAFILLVIGATYAYFAWTSAGDNTNVNLTVTKGLESMIVYNQGESILSTDNRILEVSSDYTGGISATIEFWKRPTAATTIYGQISLEILNLLSATDTTDANIAKTDTVKWAITTYNINDSTEVLLNQGTFNGKEIGDKWAIAQDFTLNPYQTFYKVYLWLDSSAINRNLSVEGELISTEISANASDTKGFLESASYKIMTLAEGDEDACVANGSGVCPTNEYTKEDGTTAYHEYRYRGANVDNYVWFNNDMYRIIGVFDDNSHGVEGEMLIKLIAANPLTDNSYGGYKKGAGNGLDYNNDWAGTIAGVVGNTNILLNQFFYNKTPSLTNYGSCTTKTYYSDLTDYRTNNCSDIVGYGIDENVRSYIEKVTWYLKGYNDIIYDKQAFYVCERSNDTEIENCTSGVSGEASKSKTGYIGLMYASDYAYASSNYASTDTTSIGTGNYANKNWLYKGSEWTMTPNSSGSTKNFYVSGSTLGSLSTAFSSGIRPSFYLKSVVLINEGDGTFENPFILSI